MCWLGTNHRNLLTDYKEKKTGAKRERIKKKRITVALSLSLYFLDCPQRRLDLLKNRIERLCLELCGTSRYIIAK